VFNIDNIHIRVE